MLGIDDAVSAVATIGGKILDRVFPDPAQAAAAKLELLKMQQSGELARLTAETDLAKGQMEVNKAEAASADPFTSRARPFIIWVCGGAMAWQYVIAPITMWVALLAHHPLPKPPTFDSGLWELMFGLLGLGGMRTWEKIKGVSK